MRVFNFGSINIDHVYRVGHIVAKGETVAGRSYRVSAGGKGANQSVALARAGVQVMHVGHVGREAGWVLEKLIAAGVNTSLVTVSDESPHPAAAPAVRASAAATATRGRRLTRSPPVPRRSAPPRGRCG